MAAADTLALATAHLRAGRLDAALSEAKTVLGDDPGNMDAMLLCGRIMRRAGRNEDAMNLYELILSHVPDNAEAHGGLGAALGGLDRYGAAINALRRAVELNPDYFEAWAFLAEALVQQGKTADAMDCFEKSLAIQPFNAAAIGKHLFYATFDPRYDPARVFDLNRAWGAQLERAVAPAPHKRPDRPSERIRIGYLSDEFYERVTARFIEPVFQAHDRARFHVTAYSRAGVRDDTADRLQDAVDCWRDVSSLDDAGVAQRIQKDGIDVLVLCTSYRAESRAPLAYKPAPVQVCYSNLVSTTGLSGVDYLFTETLTDPPGSEAFYTENLVRLSNRNIYGPPGGMNIDVSSPPCVGNGYVTFGSFNNIGKIGPEVVAVWARVLTASPTALLVLKSVDRFEDDGAVSYVTDMFAEHGIDPDRFDLLRGDPDLAAHLKRYHDVDIALDPFPCNGGTTSCEALWMGVPVVTMAGDTFMGRQGVNYLTKLDLPDLIATTPDDYVDAAVRLACDPDRIATLRRTLRGRVEARLFDAPAHVAELETAYREMHRRFKEGETPSPFSVTGARVNPDL
ncbi:MAG: tetratricopeptide repeat protein [Rhodospirillaceae bacterium]|jgi:protein O-GlcNAc transferase|nr:tetratricopeptide repeat protein [Rhodospirillaceae bacterium]MBT5666764.1 tetratricopeptide repeat protein [Rhodospirillaceae bacterium]MBT5809360.1 tetratricopeptide repeat protein [Rhodospirillaceae bacterium]